jgi:L-amino acid N-acyltransferase YncA
MFDNVRETTLATVIRLATPLDGAALAAIYRPAVTDAAISFEIEPPDAPAMAKRVTSTTAQLPWIVYESDAGIAGYAYAGAFRNRAAYQWSVEVSAYVRLEARRAGVARALYTSLFEILVLQGYRNAYAGITLPNDASVGLHRSVGFTPIGVYQGVGFKMGSWQDVGWFERPLAPRGAQPQPPTPLPELLGNPAFREALDAGIAQLRSASSAGITPEAARSRAEPGHR